MRSLQSIRKGTGSEALNVLQCKEERPKRQRPAMRAMMLHCCPVFRDLLQSSMMPSHQPMKLGHSLSSRLPAAQVAIPTWATPDIAKTEGLTESVKFRSPQE